MFSKVVRETLLHGSHFFWIPSPSLSQPLTQPTFIFITFMAFLAAFFFITFVAFIAALFFISFLAFLALAMATREV